MEVDKSVCDLEFTIEKFISDIVRIKESMEIIMQINNNKTIITSRDILDGIYINDDGCIEVKGLEGLKAEIKIDGMKYKKFYSGSYVMYQEKSTVLLKLLK